MTRQNFFKSISAATVGAFFAKPSEAEGIAKEVRHIKNVDICMEALYRLGLRLSAYQIDVVERKRDRSLDCPESTVFGDPLGIEDTFAFSNYDLTRDMDTFSMMYVIPTVDRMFDEIIKRFGRESRISFVYQNPSSGAMHLAAHGSMDYRGPCMMVEQVRHEEDPFRYAILTVLIKAVVPA